MKPKYQLHFIPDSHCEFGVNEKWGEWYFLSNVDAINIGDWFYYNTEQECGISWCYNIDDGKLNGEFLPIGEFDCGWSKVPYGCFKILYSTEKLIGLSDIPKQYWAKYLPTLIEKWKLKNQKLHIMKPSFNTVQYGQLVEVLNPDGYHSGMKIHFFNHRGVFIGNLYKFIPYDNIRFRSNRFNYERVFYGKRFETIKQFFYVAACKITTSLIRATQIMSK